MIDPRFQNRVVRDPAVCGGEPVIRGTGVGLCVIMAGRVDGDTPEETVAAFPSRCLEDAQAAIDLAR